MELKHINTHLAELLQASDLIYNSQNITANFYYNNLHLQI